MVERREAKKAGVKALLKMRLTNPTNKEFRVVAETVGLKPKALKVAFRLYCTYGYVDGTAKDGHIDRKVSKEIVQYNNRKTKLNGKTVYTNRKNVTKKEIQSAISMYLAGTKLSQIRKTTGVGSNTLYIELRKLESETPHSHDLVLGRAKALKKYKMGKISRNLGKMHVTMAEIAYINAAKKYVNELKPNVAVKRVISKSLDQNNCFKKKAVRKEAFPKF